MAGAAAALPARSYARIRGAGDRLRVGVIGAGGMATEHMKALVSVRDRDNVEVAAVCDIFQPRLDRAATLTGGRPFSDYRRILDQKDIDYILIATPEHQHASMTLNALSAGKHVYCEKPMTHTIAEAGEVVAASREAGVKLQVGVQGMSDDSYETAHRYISEGALGDVVIAQIDYSRNYTSDFWTGPRDFEARPGVNLDWKAWLGHAPRRPFDAGRFYHWRRYWDYSGGIATDLFVHRVTRIIKALALAFPERCVATGGKWHFKNSAAEIPDTFNVLLDYPGGPTVILVSSMANDTPVEHVIRGHKATLTFTRTGFTIRPQTGYENGAKEIVHTKTGGENIVLHHRNLMAAIRTGETLKCDAMLGYYGVVAADMGVQSFREQRYLRWDAARRRAVAA